MIAAFLVACLSASALVLQVARREDNMPLIPL